MKKNVTNNVNWVGIHDWELRQFHGNEYSTERGSSYNSYLVQEEKKCIDRYGLCSICKRICVKPGESH